MPQDTKVNMIIQHLRQASAMKASDGQSANLAMVKAEPSPSLGHAQDEQRPAVKRARSETVLEGVKGKRETRKCAPSLPARTCSHMNGAYAVFGT